MRVEFTEKTRGPKNILAEAEVFFDADGPFHGLKLSGFTVWRGEKGLFVTFPSREYQDKAGKRQFFDFLRPADTHEEGKRATWRLKDWILEQWKAQGAGTSQEPEPAFQAFDEDVPF